MNDFDALMDLVASDAARDSRRDYSLSVGEEIDGFKVTGYIGYGSSGEVYTAVNPDFGTECALKVLREVDGAGVERFMREAQMLAGIRHNNIVRVFRAGQWRGRAWIAMERLRALPENPSPDDVRAWVLKLCAAVTALSKAGVVHRDIKVENVLWDSVRQEPILADFGTATKQGCTSSSGTPGSSAPEQFDGKTPLDSSADVFALGKFAQRLLPEDVASADPWRRILQQALAERSLRLRTAGSLADLIQLEFRSVGAGPRHAGIAKGLCLGLAAVALVVGGWLYFGTRPDVPREASSAVPVEAPEAKQDGVFVKELKWTWPESHHVQEATSV